MAVHRDLTPILTAAGQESPSITLTGPRQSGKTTLSRAVFPQHSYVSLEAPDIRAFASEDSRAFLSQYPGRRDHRRGAAGPGAPLLPAGNHRRGPTAGPMGPDGFAEPLPVRVGEPVPGRAGQRSIIFFPWPGARSCGSPSTRRRWRRPFSPAAIPAYSTRVSIPRSGSAHTLRPTSSATLGQSARSAT